VATGHIALALASIAGPAGFSRARVSAVRADRFKMRAGGAVIHQQPCWSQEHMLSRLLLSLFLLVSTASGAASRDPEQYFFDTSFGDFAEELERAREEGKQGILLMFEMDECPFCHRMKTTVLNQPEIQDFFKAHFLIFPVDIEGDVEIHDFAGNAMTQKDFALKSYRVRATPVFAFFDLEGNLVTRFTGATGDASEFRWLGDYVVQERYKDSTFAVYKRERQAAAGQ
jgi:thioredoxin-related protein